MNTIDPSQRLAHRHDRQWPDPPFSIALWHPEIPPNTGTIARLCAATRSPLHLIEPLGFRLDGSSLRRAGLDYWPLVDLHRHREPDAFYTAVPPERCRYYSTRGAAPYTEAPCPPGTVFVFGSESSGLPGELLEKVPDQTFSIPTLEPGVRSLNLATAVAIVLYDALARHHREGLAPEAGNSPSKS